MHGICIVPFEAWTTVPRDAGASASFCENDRHSVIVFEQPQIAFGLPFKLGTKVPTGLSVSVLPWVFVQDADDRAIEADRQRVEFSDQPVCLGGVIYVDGKVANSIEERCKDPPWSCAARSSSAANNLLRVGTSTSVRQYDRSQGGGRSTSALRKARRMS